MDATESTADTHRVEFLTVEETAGLLRVSRATGYRLVRANLIPHVRVGGAIRIPALELERWIAGPHWNWETETSDPPAREHTGGASTPADVPPVPSKGERG